LKTFIDTRSTQNRPEECPHCRDGRHESFEHHHQQIVQVELAKHGFPLITDWRPSSQKALAYVNHDRWVANCPTPGCSGAEVVDPDWPLFVCMSGCGVGPLSVSFPRQRVEIERELLKRPARETRHWELHERIADLRRENKERL
jgi:hypothetical protein